MADHGFTTTFATGRTAAMAAALAATIGLAAASSPRKLLPAKTAIDLPLALAIARLGVLSQSSSHPLVPGHEKEDQQ
jgi:hypothetical protein